MPNLSTRLRHALALVPLVAAAAQAQTLGGLSNVYLGAGFTIVDNTTRTSSIVVNGFHASQTINQNPFGQSVVVRLNNLTHTWVGDVWARLSFTPTAGPTVSTLLFSRPGQRPGTSDVGSSKNFGGGYSFGEYFAGTPFAGDFIDVVRFGPGNTNTSVPSGDYYATQDGWGEYASMYGTFGGLNPNGTWTLTMRDEVGGDTGNLRDWNLAFGTTAVVPEPSTYVLMATGLGILAGVARRRRRA